MIYSYEIPVGEKKKHTIDTLNNMDKSQKHDGIKQPDAKENIVSFRIDKTNL